MLVYAHTCTRPRMHTHAHICTHRRRGPSLPGTSFAELPAREMTLRARLVRPPPPPPCAPPPPFAFAAAAAAVAAPAVDDDEDEDAEAPAEESVGKGGSDAASTAQSCCIPPPPARLPAPVPPPGPPALSPRKNSAIADQSTVAPPPPPPPDPPDPEAPAPAIAAKSIASRESHSNEGCESVHRHTLVWGRGIVGNGWMPRHISLQTHALARAASLSPAGGICPLSKSLRSRLGTTSSRNRARFSFPGPHECKPPVGRILDRLPACSFEQLQLPFFSKW